MPDSRPIAEIVDELIAARKELVGTPQPRPPNREDEYRLLWPVLVRGESDWCSVSCTLYPNSPELRFTISLLLGNICVWRLDFEPDWRIEHNCSLPGHQYDMATIKGPHCHRWAENRRFATHNMIPQTLPFRVPYDGPKTGPNVWENAFRYFLGETSIEQIPDERMPRWPRRDRLI